MVRIDARRPHGGSLKDATPGARRVRNEAIVSGTADWVRTLVSRYDPDVLLEPGRRVWVELSAPDWTTCDPERAAA
jgi:hypothetical protein